MNNTTDYFKNLKSLDYPKRIVSLSPSITEILFAIVAGKKVVGVTDYCNYPSCINNLAYEKRITRVGGYWNPSIDKIMELNPDFVFISVFKCAKKQKKCNQDCKRKCGVNIETEKKLNNLGVKTIIFSPKTFEDIFRDILLTGKICGNYNEANKLVERLKIKKTELVQKTIGLKYKPKVYFETWNNPYISSNSKTWIGNLIELSGGENIFGQKSSEWPVIDSQEIIESNPEIMIFPVVTGIARFWGSFREVKNRPGWRNMDAVRHNRLYEVDRDIISRPGPRLIEALKIFVDVMNFYSK